MALSIKDNETDALVRRLAAARKLSYTGAIKLAVSNELAKVASVSEVPEAERLRRLAVTREFQAKWKALPTLDNRSADEILGYDDDGLPT